MHVPKEAVKCCDQPICVVINLTVGQSTSTDWKGPSFLSSVFLEWHWVLGGRLPNVLTKNILGEHRAAHHPVASESQWDFGSFSFSLKS